MLAHLFVKCWMIVSTLACSKIYFRIDEHFTLATINPLSPSVTVPSAILFRQRWIDYINNPKLVTLIKALGPMYARVGGTQADFVRYVPDQNTNIEEKLKSTIAPTCNPHPRDQRRFDAHGKWVEREMTARQTLNQDKKRIVRNITFSSTDWVNLNEFCKCVGWKLIFGLNLLQRKGLAWDPSNAEKLLKYTEKRRYKVDWELGNESNYYNAHPPWGITLTPEEVGSAFLRLRELLEASKWLKSSLVVGPDMNQLGSDVSARFLNRFLQTAGGAIDRITVHQYDFGAPNATLYDFLSPRNMNKIIAQITWVKRFVNRYVPNTPIWLGETSSAFGGGVKGFSDSFLDGFTWIDKLGTTARLGVDLVIRQSIFAQGYSLIDKNFDPLPDFWLTLLYRRIVGHQVLNLHLQECNFTHCRILKNEDVRMYAHCAKRSLYMQGNVVVYFVNVRPNPVRIAIVSHHKTKHRNELYLFQPSIPGNLTSKEVLLNGKVLRLSSTLSIPPLLPIRLSHGALVDGLNIPGYSYGFLVLKTRFTACL
ncbi:unnamed protein product [Clavelina lepadiformis]|uniref:Heparanase n=1 Tax=Clavelina lepadiformis TaxID=159417 RepID=A0ABP0FAS1_CLALP